MVIVAMQPFHLRLPYLRFTVEERFLRPNLRDGIIPIHLLCRQQRQLSQSLLCVAQNTELVIKSLDARVDAIDDKSQSGCRGLRGHRIGNAVAIAGIFHGRPCGIAADESRKFAPRPTFRSHLFGRDSEARKGLLQRLLADHHRRIIRRTDA
ncbi:hypothetical protein CNYM01_14274 [Colletotrichum nymphaeae SA-01]|uniref:Uncharacterized protein n=1 Tax=Colletotrichum nymphaeae SA-01 TaxID=1460502 RepID=A0A135U6N8_9PEZI|nr:hypothetical protein CNYM01_14274 [Colletotrichum nymphaeae SA-01]